MRRRRPAPASTASTLSSPQGPRSCTTVQEDQFRRLLVEVCNLLQPEILVTITWPKLPPRCWSQLLLRRRRVMRLSAYSRVNGSGLKCRNLWARGAG
jgi:hypothetical protein